MVSDLIRSRLAHYRPASYQEGVNALKEIAQELALASLATAGFFKLAAFQGGTCLRIFHGLRRFSEDLDFVLLRVDRTFRWGAFLTQLKLEFEGYGLSLTVRDRSEVDKPVKMAFIKQDSFGQILDVTSQQRASDVQTIRIKLEVDTHPPAGSTYTAEILEFPYPASVTTQDLPSLFASKCHALLCRPFVKGRDWFDFLWYVSCRIVPNFEHLTEALRQAGPWQGEGVVASRDWLCDALMQKIGDIDWLGAREDVRPFLKLPELSGLNMWSQSLFESSVERLRTMVNLGDLT